MRSTLLIAATAALFLTTGASAQQTYEPRAEHGDWHVYTAGSGASKVCWAATHPKRSDARRNGRSVTVRRGQITLNVATRPGAGVSTEINVMMGYPLRDGSEVELSVGSKDFSLFSDGEAAWSRPADDQGIVAAFRAGSDAKVVGVSSRGTTTTDTFSLIGLTDSLKSARDLCK